MANKIQRQKKLKEEYCSKNSPHFWHKLMCENLTQETIDCKLLRRQNETRADFIAQNWGRSDSESKAKWCEQGERSTRYFSNLEKRNHSNKYITKLWVENRSDFL